MLEPPLPFPAFGPPNPTCNLYDVPLKNVNVPVERPPLPPATSLIFEFPPAAPFATKSTTTSASTVMS